MSWRKEKKRKRIEKEAEKRGKHDEIEYMDKKVWRTKKRKETIIHIRVPKGFALGSETWDDTYRFKVVENEEWFKKKKKTTRF